MLHRISKNIPKPLLFALFAAFGCFLGAIAGEAFLNVTQFQPPPPPPQAVTLLIDTSGSMKGEKLREVKVTTKQFIERRNNRDLGDSIAIVGFDSQAKVVAPLTNKLGTLEQPIDDLTAQGATRLHFGIAEAVEQLSIKTQGKRSILLFSDGQPNAEPPQDAKQLALDEAIAAKNQDIRIVAVATDDADINLLNQITGDDSLVFTTKVGSFEKAFQEAEKKIDETIIDPNSNNINQPFEIISLLKVGGWTAMLALGTGLALIIGQNLYLRRRLLTLRELIIGTIGGILVGFVAGIAGQLLYAIVPDLPIIDILSKSIGWVILGVLLGGGVAFFVPNLKPIRAMFGGGNGGFFGFLGFELIIGVFGVFAGRLLGAAILGFFIGLMIALIELVKEAWLVVHWGPHEEVIIALGEQPIILGSSDTAHIYLPRSQGFPPETATISLQGRNIEFEDKISGKRQTLKNGSRLEIGSLKIEVKTAK